MQSSGGPTAAGSTTFTDTARNDMSVFDTDVRVLNLNLVETLLRTSARNPRENKRYTLSTADRDTLNDAAAVVEDV